MKFGVYMFGTHYAIGPTELAVAVEERGFDSLLVPEHTHIPTSRLSPWPGGGELPKEYSHTVDPFIWLAAAAAVTKKIKLGTGICLVIERDPIMLAKEVASLDHISNGRVLFGIGGGWNREEMENHGTDFSRRWKVLRERVEAMKAIWTNDEADYHGEFVNFDKIWSWPKPVQKPHPPIIVGGVGEGTPRRVVRYGDIWMPNRGIKELGERIKNLQELGKEAGRGKIPVYFFGAPPEPEVLEKLQQDGVESAIFNLRPESAKEVLTKLDTLAGVMSKVA